MLTKQGLQRQVLSPTALKLLIDVQSNNNFNDFYLAGGTALALQIGHRISDDLDFFSQKEFSSTLINSLKGNNKTISLSDNSIEIFREGVRIMFMYFAFPLKEKLKTFGNVRLADPIDIGLMKLLTLQGRSTRKDLVDLYFIDREVIGLEELFELFETHYPKKSFNSYNSLKDLINRNYLEKQPMPKMLKDVEWSECIGKIESEVKSHLKKLIGN